MRCCTLRSYFCLDFLKREMHVTTNLWLQDTNVRLDLREMNSAKQTWYSSTEFFLNPQTGQRWLSFNYVRTTVEEVPDKLLWLHRGPGAPVSVQYHLRRVYDGHSHLTSHWPVWLTGQSIQTHKHASRSVLMWFSHFVCMLWLLWNCYAFLTFAIFVSHEIDDCLGECCSEPEYQYGQHSETVRGREKQGHRQKGQW